MKNLLLICGGQSPEHEISVRSAKNILKAIDRSKYQIKVVGIAKSGKWVLLNESEIDTQIREDKTSLVINPGHRDFLSLKGRSLGTIDVVFPILHGPNGEDGTIQGLLKLLNVPFVGPKMLGSAISMDKDITKKLLQHQGINVAEWMLIRKDHQIISYEYASKVLGETLFIKPANMGSSVGVSKVSGKKDWDCAINNALSFDSKVLVEKGIKGRELECAVKGNERADASGVGEVKSGEIYSYEAKYNDDSTAQTVIPADVTPEELQKLRETALKTYEALECRGLSRIDMFLTDNGEVYVNEVNTMPGFTNISMYPSLWEEEGVAYKELLDELIDFALE